MRKTILTAALLCACLLYTSLKTTPSAHDGVAVPRSPKNEVFELVRTDWEFAYENLPCLLYTSITYSRFGNKNS